MSTGFETQSLPPEDLSALVDGELDAEAVSNACRLWRTDSSSRAAWHAYQMIGDVLRSEDLASSASHDAAFLGALRARLAAEPVIPAPSAALERPAVPAVRAPRVARPARWSWAGPSAVAAGVMAVAGVLVVTRGPAPSPAAQAQADAVLLPAAGSLASGGTLMTVTGQTTGEPQSMVANGRLIRDAGLDRYLAAHKHFSGSAALGVPSAFLRSATVDASGR